jgi:hypothetical protein
MSKQVVRFAVRVRLVQVTGVAAGVDSVAVEWKRGKHKGVSSVAAAKGAVAAWDGAAGEIVIPCTMYYLPKKKSYEEKELSMSVVRGTNAKQVLGRASVALDVLAQDVGDGAEKSLSRKDNLDGGAVIEYVVSMRRLHDPRDKLPGGPTAVSSSSPMPIRPRTAGPEAASSVAAPLAESPLQSLETRTATPPAFVVSATPEPRRSPSMPTSVREVPLPLSRVDRELGYASSGGIPTSSRSQHERTDSGGAPRAQQHARNDSGGGPLPPAVASSLGGGASMASTSNSVNAMPSVSVSANSRTPSMQRDSSALQRSSELDVSGALGTSTGKTSKKSILGGAGHRRGKSHAVTPDELRGLHSGMDLRQSPLVSPAPIASSGNIAQAGRKSNAAKLGSKLGFKRGDRGSGSVSQTTTPFSPRLQAEMSDSSRRLAPDFLIAGEAASPSSSSDFEDEPVPLPTLASMRSSGTALALGSPRTSAASQQQAPGSPSPASPEHREEIQYYQRQLADQGRRKDQALVLQHFVAFGQPAFARDTSVSACVLFRCLGEWDSFANDGKEFREQLLEAFEQLSKNMMGLPQQLYWLSTLVSLLFLLRNKLKAIPRSDVPRTNALAVFQERLRGLATALAARAALLVGADLRPLIAPALLEHALLEDSAGPSAPKHKPQPHQPPQPARPTVASVLAVLENLRVALEAAHVVGSVASQVMARVAHLVAAMAVNTFLDNNPRLCTFSNGLQMRKPILELRGWMTRHHFEAAAGHLAPLEEIVNVLCMNKSALVEPEVRREVCPHLSSAQLGQLLLLYTPDSFDSEPIHPAVLAALCGDNVNDFKVDIELRAPLALELSEGSYEWSKFELPKAITDQPSLAFLSRPFAEDNALSDAW